MNMLPLVDLKPDFAKSLNPKIFKRKSQKLYYFYGCETAQFLPKARVVFAP
jgi:hypothetical protein